MLTALIHTSIALNGIATAFFLVYPLRFRDEVLRIARRVLWVAVVFQAGVVALHWSDGSFVPDSFSNIQLFTLAFLIDLTYLLVTIRWPMPLLGTFIVPGSTAMLMAILFAPVAGAPLESPNIIGAVKYVHIGSCVGGFLAFTVSVLAAGAYLLRDFSLRSKRGPSLVDHLPPLARLERVSYRAMVFGFPIYTLGLLLGTVWLGESLQYASLKPQALFSLGSWVVFALLLQMYVASGWRGARAATLNMVGYLLNLLAVLIYVLRDTQG